MDSGESQIEVVKRKKGRPRKEIIPVNESLIQEEVPKKKRGRKKKEVVDEPIKQKKKRGRKAAVKYFSSSIRKKIPLTAIIKDNNNYILHLDIKDNDENETEKSESHINWNESNEKNPNHKFNDNNETETETEDNETNHSDVIDELIEKLENESFVDDKIQELFDNDKNILSDYMNSEDDITLRELYEKRIEFRDSQDKILVDKLEKIRKDDNFIKKLLLKTNNLKKKKDSINECQQEDKQELNRKKGYFNLLHKFVENENWLEKTDVCCWWCCHKFDTIPIGLPMEYMEKTKKFLVKGIFCNFACMNAYKEDSKIMNKDYLIKHLYKKLTGEFSSNVKLEIAPPRCSLKIFGGELEIDEFRSSSSESKIYKMIEYPMFISRDYIEEIDVSNMKAMNNQIFNDVSFTKMTNMDDRKVEDARMRLSKIEESTVTTGNTIDKFIKFT